MGQYPFKKKMVRLGALTEAEHYHNVQQAVSLNEKLLFVGKLLQYAYQCYADDDALIAQDCRLTYRELFARSLMMRIKLLESGLRPGDRVVLCCENTVDFYIAYWAILQCAAVAVPVNTYLHEKELVHIIRDAQPRVVLSSDTKCDLLEQVKHIVAENIVFDLFMLRDVINLHEPIALDFDQSVVSLELPELPGDQMCLLLYTSGTTGLPKGVMLSSHNIMTNVTQVAARFAMCNLHKGERIFCVLPLFHVFAQNVCIWTPTITGSAVILVHRIDRKLILRGLAYKPTLFVGVPALYGLLCLMKTAPLDSVKLFVSGADMLPDKIRLGFALIYGRKIASGYGLTEASPVVAIHYHNQEESTQFVGPLLCGLTCEIRDDEGKKLGFGALGTLWIKGGNVMKGYYNEPQQTALVLHDDGWLNTGDLAVLDSQGHLAIRGRLKDVIIHKGFNIYPAEIENILLSHPHVIKAAVIGQEEGMGGQIPVAFVAVKSMKNDLDKELRDMCMHNLAAYKIPKKFVYLDDLPMNATGKIDKKQLRV